jgi:hypothetical protein
MPKTMMIAVVSTAFGEGAGRFTDEDVSRTDIWSFPFLLISMNQGLREAQSSMMSRGSMCEIIRVLQCARHSAEQIAQCVIRSDDMVSALHIRMNVRR